MAENNGNSGRFTGGVWEDTSRRHYFVNLKYNPEESMRLLYGRKRVVPVLFIPGIMGSRLRMKDAVHRMAWDPPSTLPGGIAALIQYIFVSAEERAQVLDPNKTEVVRNAAGLSVKADRETGSVAQILRGWDSVWEKGFRPIMEEIEIKLNAGGMPEGFDDSPSGYGFKGKSGQLTKDDFNTRLRRYRYEVWGGGYNWLQSNARSAEDLWEYVETTILKAYPEDILNEKGKIIIVTHSMGGLVARAMFTDKARAEKRVLGAVHTVMPALGAPAAYKRMRAGFEGIGSIVLGYNAADVTRVLAASQGGLELLPFASYKKGGVWLTCPKEIMDEQGASHLLPWMGDPYKTIYKSTKWYGIVPYYHEYMLGNNGKKLSARDQFNAMIDKVKIFHESILDVYHPISFAVWGAFKEMEAWGEVVWERKPIPFYKFFTSRSDEHKDTQLGRVYQGDQMADIQRAECPGDGTVPNVSAEGQLTVKPGYFIHSEVTPKSGQKSYEHSECFEHKMMKWSVIYSVACIVLETLGKK